METNIIMELELLEGKISDVDKKVSSILFLLRGNELDEDAGLVNKIKMQQKEINDLERRMERLEKVKDRILWVSIGLSLPTTYGAASLIYQFFKAITGK